MSKSEIQMYSRDSALEMRKEMLAARTSRLVVPLWGSMADAWLWFLARHDFSSQEVSEARESFRQGWFSYTEEVS